MCARIRTLTVFMHARFSTHSHSYRICTTPIGLSASLLQLQHQANLINKILMFA